MYGTWKREASLTLEMTDYFLLKILKYLSDLRIYLLREAGSREVGLGHLNPHSHDIQLKIRINFLKQRYSLRQRERMS